MNPVSLLLMQNIRTNNFNVGTGGIPEVTVEDSVFACSNSLPKYYYAARVVTMGDDSESTLRECEHHLWMAVADIVAAKSWDIPAGAEVYRNLCGLSIAEHLRPDWFKNQTHRVMLFNELNDGRKPKKPLEMTIDKWKKKWSERYKVVHNELNEMANIHLRHMRRKIG